MEPVSDRVCATCHQEIADRFAHHPMGRSAAVVDASQLLGNEQLADVSFRAGDYRYLVRQVDGQLSHRQERLNAAGDVLASTELPVVFAIGSGTRGRSYLVQRDDFLFMSPVTWYGQSQRWDLSPGYEESNSEFNRPVIPECLFCHTNFADHVPASVNRYRADPFPQGCAIGCQRCHGDGAEHAAFHDGTESVTDTMLHLEDLSRSQRDAVCQQCHVSGAVRIEREGKSWHDFHPGDELDEVVRVFNWQSNSDSAAQFVGHFEQMVGSQCFLVGGGVLSCTHCHDPHQVPSDENRSAYFIERCLACHERDACQGEPAARQATMPEDNCIACHMPRQSTEVQHAATTDHRIPRRAPSTAEMATQPPSAGLPRALVPFARLGSTTPSSDSDAFRRDEALAVLKLHLSDERLNISGLEIGKAVRRLKDHCRSHADDLPAYDALARGAIDQQDFETASQALQHLLRKAPRHPAGLANLSQLASATGDLPRAVRFAQLARQSSPWSVVAWYRLAAVLHQAGQFDACLEVAREGNQRFPTSMGLRHLMIACHLELGDRDAAKRELDAMERFDVPEWDQVKQWYDRHPGR